MCYGHWMQCSFMNGPPAFGRKNKAPPQRKTVLTEMEKYKLPAKCQPPRQEIYLYAFEDPTHPDIMARHKEYTEDGNEEELNNLIMKRKMQFKDAGLIFGGDWESEGAVFVKHPTVEKQHAAILHNQGKIFLKAINGVTKLRSISSFEGDFLMDPKTGKKPRFFENEKGVLTRELAGGIDKVQQLTKEFCCFSLGSSPTVYWVNWSGLPLGDDEREVLAGGKVGGENERKQLKDDDKGKDDGDRRGRDDRRVDDRRDDRIRDDRRGDDDRRRGRDERGGRDGGRDERRKDSRGRSRERERRR